MRNKALMGCILHSAVCGERGGGGEGEGREGEEGEKSIGHSSNTCILTWFSFSYFY